MAKHVWAVVHTAKKGRKMVYGISFPDFPGLASGGCSLDDAVERGQKALAFHVAGMAEDGEAIPAPRSLEDLQADQDFMESVRAYDQAAIVRVLFEGAGRPVRVNISIDDNLLAQIDRVAGETGKTRSGFIAEAARDRLKADA